jgi:hypothetical protein
LLEAAGLIELCLDAVAACIDALDQPVVYAEIAEHAEKDEKGNRYPGFSFEHRLPQRLST